MRGLFTPWLCKTQNYSVPAFLQHKNSVYLYCRGSNTGRLFSIVAEAYGFIPALAEINRAQVGRCDRGWRGGLLRSGWCRGLFTRYYLRGVKIAASSFH